MNETAEYWRDVWSGRDPTQVSWFQADPRVSLDLLRSVTTPRDGVVDVGGGTSALVQRLAAGGYRDLTVVDIAAPALAILDQALTHDLGADHGVDLVHSDIRFWRPARAYRCWHDRAALHFLTAPTDRRAYADLAAASIETGGHLVVATFALDGPEQCSGLPVHRSDPADLAQLFASDFDLVATADEHHETPWHSTQHFQYSVLRRH